MAKNALMARAPPLTPLGELTELPNSLAVLRGKGGEGKKSSDEGKAERRERMGWQRDRRGVKEINIRK